jgi:hypothetical protein
VEDLGNSDPRGGQWKTKEIVIPGVDPGVDQGNMIPVVDQGDIARRQ